MVDGAAAAKLTTQSASVAAPSPSGATAPIFERSSSPLEFTIGIIGVTLTRVVILIGKQVVLENSIFSAVREN